MASSSNVAARGRLSTECSRHLIALGPGNGEEDNAYRALESNGSGKIVVDIHR